MQDLAGVGGEGGFTCNGSMQERGGEHPLANGAVARRCRAQVAAQGGGRVKVAVHCSGVDKGRQG